MVQLRVAQGAQQQAFEQGRHHLDHAGNGLFVVLVSSTLAHDPDRLAQTLAAGSESTYGVLYNLAKALGTWDHPLLAGTYPENPYPIEFVREVRAEVARVTWPTRRETMITTSMVFIFVVISSLFFLVADKIIGFVVKLLLGVS